MKQHLCVPALKTVILLLVISAVSLSCKTTRVASAPANCTSGAIAFDGIDDYIDLGNIYDDVALPVTVSAWVWIDADAPDGKLAIFDSQDGAPAYNGFHLTTDNRSHVAAEYGDGQGQNHHAYRRAKSGKFPAGGGRWVHMAIVMRSGTDMSVLLNGVEIAGSYAGSSSRPMNSNSPTETAKIGVQNINDGVFRFKGKLDEIRVWNRALTETEIQTAMLTRPQASSNGLVGYWDFDEADGDRVLDKSGKNFHGVLHGNPARVAGVAVQ